MNEDGEWHTEGEVTVIDENLVEQMGRAIEEYDGR
jgi:hypothetical protein